MSIRSIPRSGAGTLAPVHPDLSVAIDAGPLHGHRTGVGNAVAWTIDALADQPIELRPYVTSSRARVVSPERRLPLPAAVRGES